MNNSFKKILLPVVMGTALTVTSCQEEKNYEVRTASNDKLIDILNNVGNSFYRRDQGLSDDLAETISNVEEGDTLHLNLVTWDTGEQIYKEHASTKLKNKVIDANKSILDIESIYITKKKEEDNK